MMKLNFNECKLERATNFNNRITCLFNDVLDFTIEPNDILSWIDNCNDPDLLFIIMKKAQHQRSILFQKDDDDFRSRA